MEQGNYAYGTSRRNQKNKYKRMIESGRDELNEWQMEVLFTLYEQPTIERAAAELDVTVDELQHELATIVRIHETTERQTKEGKPYKKRLARAAFINILNDYPDLTDDERAMVQAMSEAPNQVVAAQSLGMTYDEFQKRFLQMRRTHDF